MARDGEIPAIFNPRRARTPSVVLTSGDPINGPFTAVPQITHSDSLTSGQQDGCGDNTTTSAGVLIQEASTVNQTQRPTGWLRSCKASCCSELMQKMYFGVCVTVLVTATWVGATHCIKFLYLKRSARHHFAATLGPSNKLTNSSNHQGMRYDAPFFTTWFCTNWAVLFFPIYALVRMATGKCESPTDIFAESLRAFRDKGFTAGRFLSRCCLFCVLWVATSYVYVHSLRVLLATDVMALFATNVASVYLLSWVILHEQFVGVRIVAVILCDTGIALLAYMDGITGSPTLGGVVLAAAAAAGYAVYKVLFRKVIGEATHAQTALFFSLLGLLNAALLWPLCLALYFTGVETLPWDKLPWPVLLAASGLLLVFNLLTHFSMAVTYNLFVTLGLITAVPVSAALDVVLYGATFAGMKLAGVILIAVGFFLVMFPDNWPTYITRLLRNIIMLSHSARWGRKARPGSAAGARRDAVDYRTGYIRSHLRSPSGRVR